MKRAFITGVTGQDGAYLSKLLLEKGYTVVGLVRRQEAPDTAVSRLRWLNIANDVHLVEGDLTDLPDLVRLMNEHRPDEIYNLASVSVVASSWQQPILTAKITANGVLSMLEAIKCSVPHARFYQASSSEMYGLVRHGSPNEATPFHPRSPYAVSKLFGHWSTVNYRESFGLHASNGILFNHESPLRGLEFVTRKITDGVARIKLGKARHLRLGNIDVRRDWGHARDYVAAMHLMLQQDVPDDYVIATGQATSLREICRMAFCYAGLTPEDHIVIDPELFRPAEIDCLIGDPSKARSRLGWRATTSVEDTIMEMVEADLLRVRQKLS